MDIPELVAFFTSPIASILLGAVVWKLKDEVKDLKNVINNNGFVKRDMLEAKLKIVDVRHENVYEDIRGIQSRLTSLEINRK